MQNEKALLQFIQTYGNGAISTSIVR